MHSEGFKFFLADNGVWLIDQVPPEFMTIVTEDQENANCRTR